jgi:transposase InsO family protein
LILDLVDESSAKGVSLEVATNVIGVSSRTVGRWRQHDGGEDQRRGPKKEPSNKLSAKEREQVLKVADSVEYRDLSPKQIVPKLADKGTYVASESTFYRVLREEGQLAHREKSRPASRKPDEHVATGPCQVWSWDITYLRSALRGCFFYLYLVVDIWSRKIVGWSVEETESTDLAAALFRRTCAELGIDPNGLVLHSDNGGPMKGSTMLATLQRLGVVPSFSRPHVSDDNPFSESLFRTMKFRPDYPSKPFASVEEARAWVAAFVAWYNTEHLHSAIRFVTPDDRHSGRDLLLLERRRQVYERARRRHPERWSGATRSWDHVETVRLNPQADSNITVDAYGKAA